MLRRARRAEAITVNNRVIRSVGGPQREMRSPRPETDGVRWMPPRRYARGGGSPRLKGRAGKRHLDAPAGK
jgi:hypothetical protein